MTKMDEELKDAVDKATGLVDMKRTKAEIKGKREEFKDSGLSDEAYPYGLELRLENTTLDKLGIDGLPKVGEKMRVEAIAVVESASSNERLGKDGKPKPADRNLCLQITKLGISKAKG